MTDLVDRLREKARGTAAELNRQIADRPTAFQHTLGGFKPEDMLEWQAADEIERLQKYVCNAYDAAVLDKPWKELQWCPVCDPNGPESQ